MILADSSVWIDHIRTPNPDLMAALTVNRVRMHPYVIGELALGNLKNRSRFLMDLSEMLPAPMCSHDEVMLLVERHALQGSGLGWVDASLLASVVASRKLRLMTRDGRLAAAAQRLGVSAPVHH